VEELRGLVFRVLSKTRLYQMPDNLQLVHTPPQQRGDHARAESEGRVKCGVGGMLRDYELRVSSPYFLFVCTKI